jgi:hypothetical protein
MGKGSLFQLEMIEILPMRLSIIPVVKYQFECIHRESALQWPALIFLTASSDIFSRNTRNSTWTWYGLNTD